MTAHVQTPSLFDGTPATEAAAMGRNIGGLAGTRDEFTLQWSKAQLPVRAYLTSYLSDKSAIDDCIQEVALLAWKKGPRGAEAPAFVGYCLACAKRVGMREVRKKYRNKLQLLSPEIVASLADAAAAKELKEDQEPALRLAALRRCLDTLGPGPRRLLELRYTSGDRKALQKEANSSGKSMESIYKRLERLRHLLKHCVAGRGAGGR